MGVCVRGLEYFAVAIPPGTRSGVGRLKGCQLVGWIDGSRCRVGRIFRKNRLRTLLYLVYARGGRSCGGCD